MSTSHRTRHKVTDFLSREEIKALLTTSDGWGAWAVFVSWGTVLGSLLLVGTWPGPLTLLVALVLVGGRQLGLSILMHEAAHRTLFRTRWLNDAVGEWVCAAPVWSHLGPYRKHHLAHHAHANQEKDPDLGLVRPFPVSHRSLRRKLLRDVFGLTGLKRIYGLLLMDFGFITYTASTDAKPIPQAGRTALHVVRTGLANFGPVVLTNVVLFGVLASLGIGWTWWVWFLAYLTTFSVFVRVRSMAEHACTEQSDDAFHNTRTTHADVLSRLTVAPHRVNFHLEHHLLMTVPHQNLPQMHSLLRARGAIDGDNFAPNYTHVLRLVVRQPVAS